jgi:hypothetical protein
MSRPNKDAQIIAGLYDLGNIQDRLRKYAQDKDVFRFIMLRQNTPISLIRVISEKFGAIPSGKATDWEFKYNEMDELPYMFKLNADTINDNNVIVVSNNIGVTLLESTRMQVDGLFCKLNVGNVDTDTSTEQAGAFILPEQIIVLKNYGTDSGGEGLTNILVKRLHPSASYTGTPKVIKKEYKITVTNIVVPANVGYQPVVSKNAVPLSNLIQITRKSYGIGEQLSSGIVETYLSSGNEFLNNSYVLAEKYVSTVMEHAILTNRKSKRTVNGNPENETGGILEFVKHWMDMEGKIVTPQGLNELLRYIADLLSVSELWWFTGTELSQGIADAFDERVSYTTNEVESMKYKVLVKELETTGRSLKVYHVTAPVLNNIGMSNAGIFLNLTEYNWNEKNKLGAFQICQLLSGEGKGFVDLPDDKDSYGKDDGNRGVVRELVGYWGLMRRLAETHLVTYNWAKPKLSSGSIVNYNTSLDSQYNS